MAWSTVNVETPTPFCRSLRRLLLVITGSGIGSSIGARVGAGTRGGGVERACGAGGTVVAGGKITGLVLTGAMVEGNTERGGDRQGEGASVSGKEGLLKIEN